jgi:hypothetical protein
MTFTYVKIYETAVTMFYVFLNQKTNIRVNFGNVLWVAFSISSGSLLLVKYPAYYIGCSFNILVALPMKIFCFCEGMSRLNFPLVKLE